MWGDLPAPRTKKHWLSYKCAYTQVHAVSPSVRLIRPDRIGLTDQSYNRQARTGTDILTCLLACLLFNYTMHIHMSARLSVRPSVSQSGPDRTVCLSVCLDLYLCQCFLLSVIRAAFIAAMPPLYPGGIPSCPVAVHPVCPDCPSLGNARRDLAELHLEDSSNWRCPPGCQHCFHMGRPTNLIPQTPLMCHSVYSQMCPHTPKRPRPVWCKVLNEKFTKWQRWSNWQRQYETTAKWQRWPIGG